MEIDRAAYEDFLEWQSIGRNAITSVMQQHLGHGPTPIAVLTYEEWLRAGMPGEKRIRSVLAAFCGRPEMLDPPTLM